MKKQSFFFALLFTTIKILGQDCIAPGEGINIQGAGTRILCGGEYPDIRWEGTLIIKSGSVVTFPTSVQFPGIHDGTLIVEEGATLNILGQDLVLNGVSIIYGTLNVLSEIDILIGHFQVKQTAVVNAGSIMINRLGVNITGIQIDGKVNVSGNVHIRASMFEEEPFITFSGCGYLIASTLENEQDNSVVGRGFIKIVEGYPGDGRLTPDTSIVVEYLGSGTPDFGDATMGVFTCAAHAIKYVPGSLKIIKVTKL